MFYVMFIYRERERRAGEEGRGENGENDSLSYQGPISDWGAVGQNPGLVYRNQYSSIQECSASSLLSIKKCHVSTSDFEMEFVTTP